MFGEKIDSGLGDGSSCLLGVENRLVSTRLEMSSSWISVMQATMNVFLLVTHMLFALSGSSIDQPFFFFFFFRIWFSPPFFFFHFCSKLNIKLVLISWAFWLSVYQNFPFGITLIPSYTTSLLLTYVKLWSLSVSPLRWEPFLAEGG